MLQKLITYYFISNEIFNYLWKSNGNHILDYKYKIMATLLNFYSK